MDYDLISSMRVEELKNFLKLRGLKVSGRKVELVARVFAASENNVPPVKTAVEIEQDLHSEYHKKLIINDVSIPDPFKLEEWLSEDEGRIFWPMVLYPDIFHYLMFFPSELASTDLSDYKQCKAYSYYKSGWLQELKFHNIELESPYCIIKSECRRSEKINDTFHQLWVILDKKTARILGGHCTCMAGMGQTCNHVAAALFRVEATVRLGLSNPSCTSKPNEWLPCRKDVAPTKIKNINYSREDFAQRGKKKRSLVSTPKKVFNPLVLNTTKLLNLNDIAKALEKVSPNSIIHTAVAKPEVDFVIETLQFAPVKPSTVSVDDVILMSDNKEDFKNNLKSAMTIKNIEEIEKITQGQSTNDFWFTFRKGVVSASKCHDVLTKMNKILKGGDGYVNVFNVNQNISGLTYVNPNIPALKYGRNMEEHAVNSFFEDMKTKHKHLKLTECGLYLDKNLPFIGASPDRKMSCSCCPPACVEIKCPFSINYTSPEDETVSLPFLNDQKTLKRTHSYYTQCLTQMGVTNIHQLYFMTWTPHGHIIELIKFDSKTWDSVKERIAMYYDEYYLKTIFDN